MDFSLADSSLALAGLINVQNGTGAGSPMGNAGSVVTGTARVILTGVDASGMLTGGPAAATVQGVGLNFALNQGISPLLPGNNLVGPITVTQMGMAAGTFDGASVSLAQNQFVTQLSTNLNCVGDLCALVPGAAAAMGIMIAFPVQINATITNDMAPFALSLTGLGGMAMINAAVMQMNMGQAVNLIFAGREVARNFVPDAPQVPEPVEAGLLILGVLALCGVAAVRRQPTA